MLIFFIWNNTLNSLFHSLSLSILISLRIIIIFNIFINLSIYFIISNSNNITNYLNFIIILIIYSILTLTIIIISIIILIINILIHIITIIKFIFIISNTFPLIRNINTLLFHYIFYTHTIYILNIRIMFKSIFRCFSIYSLYHCYCKSINILFPRFYNSTSYFLIIYSLLEPWFIYSFTFISYPIIRYWKLIIFQIHLYSITISILYITIMIPLFRWNNTILSQ